ncbi:hypothetical protein BD779DRAFT_1511591 [Infundibulicybe gibba]|nr:hypothetical protein BD779DRAFT_1511591 [Infundibulicybe gibba]
MSIIFNNSFLTSRGPLFSLILDSSTPALAAAGRIVKERSEQANDTLRNLSLCSRAYRPALAEGFSDDSVIISSTPMRKRIRAGLSDSSPEESMPLNPMAAVFLPSSICLPPGDPPSLLSARKARKRLRAKLRQLPPAPLVARPTPGEQVQVHEPPAELTRRVNKWLAKSQMTFKVSPDPQEGYANIATRDPIVQPRFLPVEHLRYHNHSTRGEIQFHAPLPAPNWLPGLSYTIPTQPPFRDAPTTGPPTRNLAPRHSYIRTPLAPPTTYGYPHYIPTTDPSHV